MVVVKIKSDWPKSDLLLGLVEAIRHERRGTKREDTKKSIV
jgi:hypothetical protein